MRAGIHNVDGEMPCPICTSADIMPNVAYINRDYQGEQIFTSLTIKVCQTCGFGFALPHITTDELKEFYARAYRSHDSPNRVRDNKIMPKNDFNPRAYAQMILGSVFIDVGKVQNFLDLGPGVGYSFGAFSKLVSPEGMYAIEPDIACRKSLKAAFPDLHLLDKIEQIRGACAEGAVDLVLSSHSLEHFGYLDLFNVLDGVRTSMSDGAVVIIEVPNVDLRCNHKYYRDNDAPHLLFFSSRSLGMLMEQCGFEVLFLNTCGPKYAQLGGFGAMKSKDGVKISFRSIVRKYMPIAMFKLIRKIKSLINFNVVLSKMWIDHDDFRYGGNRTYLRVVARKRKI